MNIYQTWFAVQCPTGGWNSYHIRIESKEMIMVEKINEVVTALGPAFHEEIADTLITSLGGLQTITANHHGVEIETRRGSL